MPDQTVLITGVNGFIAGIWPSGCSAKACTSAGPRGGPTPRPGLRSRARKSSRPTCSIATRSARAADGCRAVVHAAAWTGGPELTEEAGYEVNVDGTANVLAAAAKAGVERFIYISSVAVYGLNRSPLIDERAETPRSARLIRTARSRRKHSCGSMGCPS